MSFELVLRNGTIVDGSGTPRYQADVAIDNGIIVEIGKVTGRARRTIDADGLVVAPGVIDVHTHYDAQVCWDPVLASSLAHGVTTVIQGNCGIGVAPCRPQHREAVLRDLVVLEGIPYDVLDAGVGDGFETFPDYMQHLRDRGLGINVAAFVPLSPLRRYVLGSASTERAATAEERAIITEHLSQSVRAGALGFSTSMVRRQVGEHGAPLPSQFADFDELRAYAGVLAKLSKGAIQANVVSNIAKPTEDELAILEFLLDAGAGRTVTYSGANHRADEPDAIEEMLQRVEPLRLRGAIPQTTVQPVFVEVGFRSPTIFSDVAAFKRIFSQSADERMATYADPAWRATAKAEVTTRSAMFGTWPESVLLRTTDRRLREFVGMTVTAIGAQLQKEPFDAMLDMVLVDPELRLLAAAFNADSQHLRNHIKDPRVLVGLHDAGAHLDLIFQGGFPTYLLGHWVREQQALTLEHAIKRMTSEPAKYFGLEKRGRIAEGLAADLMVFDPEAVNSPERPDQVVSDLPAGGTRLYSTPTGMIHVVVNGLPVIQNGVLTEARPGLIVN